MKVLHIDDNEDVLEPIEIYFDLLDNFDYTSCSDPVKGLKLIKQGDFDAVILDLAMPGLSGYDIIDSLYESGEIKKQNIVIFSASSSVQEQIQKRGGC